MGLDLLIMSGFMWLGHKLTKEEDQKNALIAKLLAEKKAGNIKW
jgi:hypothetical protein